MNIYIRKQKIKSKLLIMSKKNIFVTVLNNKNDYKINKY